MLENKTPDQPPRSAPISKPHALRGKTSPFLMVKDGGIVELGGLIVRRQCLGGRPSINSAEAFSGIVRLLVELPRQPAHTLTELGNSFPQPSCDLGKVFSAEEDQDHSKNQKYFGHNAWRGGCCLDRLVRRGSEPKPIVESQ